MTADLSVLDGPRLVLLTAIGDTAPRTEACGLCSAPLIVGPYLVVLDLADGRAAFTCGRCAREVDAPLAAISEALGTIGALIEGLDDVQNRAGLKRALLLLAGSLPEPAPTEGTP